MKDFSALEKKLGFPFQNKELLNQSVIHRSYLNEHPNFPLQHNERLEFLGDAVLELVVTSYLYNHYPNSEGELTSWRAALVNAKSLSEVAKELELGEYLYLSRGESKDQNGKARQYILANTIESIIGALYLDRGLKIAEKFIKKHILSNLPMILEKKLFLDPKSRFQEAAQEKMGITPSYRVLSEKGPDHSKMFEIGAYLENELIAKGAGYSKQEAQVEAAAKALGVKGW